DQTARYLAALRNPDVHILAHPRGRIWDFRAGLTADWPRVFALATELDKAVEIDSYPDRQDLNLDLLRLARAAGTRITKPAFPTTASSTSSPPKPPPPGPRPSGIDPETRRDAGCPLAAIFERADGTSRIDARHAQRARA